MTFLTCGATARRRLVGLVLPVALLMPLAACSSSDAPDGTAAAPVPTALLEAATGGGPPEVRDATDLTRKPVAGAGKGTPPAELLVQDLVSGTGDEANEASTVQIRYVGTIWKTGREFDASWDPSAPVEFPLLNMVVGFSQGVAGMKEGGRRLIVIPPDLGYGPTGGRPPEIMEDDTMVFVVDLISIGAAEGPADGGEAGAGGSTTGSL